MTPHRIPPGPGQESVWDYPRPPRLEDTSKQVQIVYNGMVVADSRRAKRVLETSHPPVYYLPPDDVTTELLISTRRATFCEWKGLAAYYTLSVGDRQETDAAWYYPDPTPAFAALKNFIAFYPSKMDACFVDGEGVQAQPGDFYGGWITRDIVGPFKGDPSTRAW